MSDLPDCAAWQGDFRGWNACYLNNGYISLVAVPDIGGRVMAYNLDTYAFLFVDPSLAGKLYSPQENQGDSSLAAWKNYGGDKTWPAPQGWDHDGQWHGPPDPILDSGRYTLQSLGADGRSASLQMASPPDSRTGIQLTRQLTIFKGSSRVKLNITFGNTKERAIRWSIWDVTQLRAERLLPDGKLSFDPSCEVTTPLNAHSRFVRGYYVMFGPPTNSQWQADVHTGLFRAPYQWEIGKVGIDSTAGWIAFSNPREQCAFVAQFTYEPHTEYPDQGATVEVWTTGKGQVGNLNYADSDIYLMEAEILSPLRTIEPGASTGFDIQWGSCRCKGTVRDVTEGGCIMEPPYIETVDPDSVRLLGQVGVFDVGELHLAWLDKLGRPVQVQPLGPVDPLKPVHLDQRVPRPIDAKGAELRIAAHDGVDRHLATVHMI